MDAEGCFTYSMGHADAIAYTVKTPSSETDTKGTNRSRKATLASAARRRDQNRVAQQKYRERKTSRIKTLEALLKDKQMENDALRAAYSEAHKALLDCSMQSQLTPPPFDMQPEQLIPNPTQILDGSALPCEEYAPRNNPQSTTAAYNSSNLPGVSNQLQFGDNLGSSWADMGHSQSGTTEPWMNNSR
ncbi:hypothetical protein BX600DRAFT_444288 [Xylariales sp. PMI_506]|nr:hypothetical protein BX600DRAFT_444288 [Xylariales sp. PMI_506]